MHLIDSYNRKLDYLRISLTDRCNFRCVYCMPPEGITLLPKNEVLSLEEIGRLAGIFISLGTKKIRLTGGEPLLRKNIVSLVRDLASVAGLEELGLTTNGFFLAPLAHELKANGLSSVNISIDSLNRLRFHHVTRTDSFEDVFAGFMASLEAGLKVKVNVVAMNDLGEKEVESFVELAKKFPVELRFLEFMPLCGSAWQSEKRLSLSQLKQWVSSHCSLVPIPRGRNVADTFQIEGHEGKIGFISSMSEPFCGDCSRLRLTSTGMLRLCLFSPLEMDLRTPLRQGALDEEIAALITRSVLQKPKGHEEYLEKTKYSELPKIRSVGG
ncbi:MAG: hypothetical protein ACD_73C00675G0002 [uncultured bacterium]|nr:MAG: hypothetical protein ACD_73C00675G0002 [uncultured bacterium]